MADIKAMGLYRNVDRVLADLAATDKGLDGTLSVDDLTPFDQYHYEGTDAVDDAIARLGATSTSSILDIGSGLGGPARYIAARTGSQVTALELQGDLDETAADLTRRCGLDHLVRHVHGDVLTGVLDGVGFDGIVSMLCFLHIADRAALFARCAGALRPGGRMFIDDYVARSPLTEQERRDLADKVYCPHVPTEAAYVDDLAQAGFVEIEHVDKSDDWTRFVVSRLAAFRAARTELVERYDAATVDGLEDFYSTVAELFLGGNLGGARIIAIRS